MSYADWLGTAMRGSVDEFGLPYGSPSISLTSFTSPYNATTTGNANITGSGSSLTSVSSLLGIAQQAANANKKAVSDAATSAADLALQTSKKLDPYVANRFYENLDRAFPGYREVFSQMTANANSLLRGEVPSDVAEQIAMFAGEQNMSNGLNATALNLGKTSVEFSKMGADQASNLFAIATNSLTPKFGDPYTIAESIRKDIVDTGTLSPANAVQAALAARSQDIQLKQIDNQYTVEAARLRQQASQFSAEQGWATQMDRLNRQWAQHILTLQQDNMVADRQARLTEQATAGKKYNDMLAMLRGSGSTSVASSSVASKTTPASKFAIGTQEWYNSVPQSESDRVLLDA